MTLRIQAILACGLFVISACAVAANNWAYSELNKTVPGQGGNSPEDDARPGEYYFMRGVEAFRAGDYVHAVRMYETAASWGYKNAQYNLGVMYARGQGVEVDLPRAMAWLALAAERNEKQYVDGRELVYAQLDKDQWDRANVLWRDLKRTYSDSVALPRAKARWAEVRQSMTGSHVGSIGHLEIGGGAPSAPGVAKVSALADAPEHASATAIKRNGGNISAGALPMASNATAADVAGPNTVDGVNAYKSLRETDNPYDPKFNPAIGTATVGTPVASDAERKKPTNEAASQH